MAILNNRKALLDTLGANAETQGMDAPDGLAAAAAPGVRPGVSAGPPIIDTGVAAGKDRGPITDAAAAPGGNATAEPSAAPSWNPGAKAGQDVTLLGFDRDKLFSPDSGSAAGSKYTPAAKAFAQGLKQDVGLSRGGLGNMTAYLKANGFPNAKEVGDDKIDFGDGQGPIDVIRGGDNQIVFQNTTGNPTWEGQHGGAGGASDGGMAPDAGAALGGPQFDSALSGDPLAKIQQLISQMSGSRPNFAALMQQLGGQ